MGYWIRFIIKIKMKNIIYIILVLFIISCDDTWIDAGDIVRKEIKVNEFSKLVINDNFEIFFIQDTLCKIEVEAAEKLIPNIEFKFNSENELVVTDNNKNDWLRGYDKTILYITVNELSFLKIKAVCNVKSLNTIETQRLNIWAIGDYTDINLDINTDNFYIVDSESSGGYYKFKGKTTNFGFWARGSAIIDASELSSVKAVVESESIGDCYINVSGIIEAKIYRSGNRPRTLERAWAGICCADYSKMGDSAFGCRADRLWVCQGRSRTWQRIDIHLDTC